MDPCSKASYCLEQKWSCVVKHWPALFEGDCLSVPMSTHPCSWCCLLCSGLKPHCAIAPWLLHCGQCTATAELGVLLLTSSMPRRSASRSRSPTQQWRSRSRVSAATAIAIAQSFATVATQLEELTRRVNFMDELLKQLADERLMERRRIDALERRINALEAQRRADDHRIQELENALHTLRMRLHIASLHPGVVGPSRTPAGSPPAGSPPAGPPPATPAKSATPAGPPPATPSVRSS